MRPRVLAVAAATLGALILAVRLSGPRPSPPPAQLQGPPLSSELAGEAPRLEPPREPERPPLPAPVPEPPLHARSESPELRGGDLFFYAPEGVPAELDADGQAGAGKRWKRVLSEHWYDGGDPAVFKRTVRRYAD